MICMIWKYNYITLILKYIYIYIYIISLPLSLSSSLQGVSTIRSLQQRMGWTRTKAMYGQLIRNHNKAARLVLTIRMHELHERFANVIYTNESTFWIKNNAHHYYKIIGTVLKKISTHTMSMYGVEFQGGELQAWPSSTASWRRVFHRRAPGLLVALHQRNLPWRSPPYDGQRPQAQQ